MRLLLLLGIVAAVLAQARPLRAEVLTFVIDSAQSHITLAIELPDGTQISSAQAPGSDTTTPFGSAQVDVTADTIQFLPSGNGQFAIQPIDQSPLADGSLGTAPAQFGLNVTVPGIGGGVSAVRQLVGDVTSGVLPLSGGSFDSTQLVMQFVTGSIAYNLNLLGNPFVGSVDITAPVANQVAGGSLTKVGNIYTLSIPIDAIGEATVGGIALVGAYTGQIVATAVVPEPATIGLFLTGGMGVVVMGWRRRQRHFGSETDRASRA